MNPVGFYTLYTHLYTHLYTPGIQCWRGITRFTRISSARVYVHVRVRETHKRILTRAREFYACKACKACNPSVHAGSWISKACKEACKSTFMRVKEVICMKTTLSTRSFMVMNSAEAALQAMRERAEHEQMRWCIGTHPSGYIVMRHSWAVVHGIRHSVSYIPRINEEE